MPPDDLGAFSLSDNVECDDRHSAIREVGRITRIEPVHLDHVASVLRPHVELLAERIGCRACDLIGSPGEGPSEGGVISPACLKYLARDRELRPVWEHVRREVVGERQGL